MRPYVLYNEVFSSSYFAVVVSYQATRCKIRHKLSLFRHKIRCFDQGSISPTFYVRLFNSKVLNAAFMYLHLRFVLFLRKNIGAKGAHKMLVKLSQKSGQFLSSKFIYWSETRDVLSLRPV